MMFYLEDEEGDFLMESFGFTDDLDFAHSFKSRELAEDYMAALPEPDLFKVFQEIK